jgi:hypothetical protein
MHIVIETIFLVSEAKRPCGHSIIGAHLLCCRNGQRAETAASLGAYWNTLMFKPLKLALRLWPLVLLGECLVLSQPVFADGSSRIDSGQGSMIHQFVGSSGHSRESAIAHKPAHGRPAPDQITAPAEPTEEGGWWAFYAGKMQIHDNPYYDPHGIDFKWAYSRKNPLPKNPRIVVLMHGSGCGEGCMEVFGPSPKGDIEVRTQDAEAYNQDWREWWTFGRDGTPYPGRRIAAALDFLVERYGIDTSSRGIVLDGPSMGGAGAVIQTMILPDPWRRRIAYSSASAGVIMPRQIAQKDPGQYITFPPDNPSNRRLWDSIDFSIQAAVDPIVRGMHYRHAFSSDDQFSAGLHGNTQLEFVNLVEQNKIGGAFTWVKTGHGSYEEGVVLPDISAFESQEQDVTLDRAHPAITNSSGNYPLRAADRTNETKYPRGHYNMGITWNHANIVDETSQIVFPLKYNRRTGIGKGVPDQPLKITISVTPRRPRNFTLTDGETLKWSWDRGALSGLATVTGDTVTIDAIPLVSGGDYKTLRIYR